MPKKDIPSLDETEENGSPLLVKVIICLFAFPLVLCCLKAHGHKELNHIVRRIGE